MTLKQLCVYSRRCSARPGVGGESREIFSCRRNDEANDSERQSRAVCEAGHGSLAADKHLLLTQTAASLRTAFLHIKFILNSFHAHPSTFFYLNVSDALPEGERMKKDINIAQVLIAWWKTSTLEKERRDGSS